MNKEKISVLFGPPGTGKTTSCIAYLEKLLGSGIDPSRIAYVSFTNKGVDAGVRRARSRFNLSPEDTPYWRTLHSISNQEACGQAGSLIKTEHFKLFGNKLGLKLSGYYDQELKNNVDDIYLFLEQLKRNNSHKFAEWYSRLSSTKVDLSKILYINRNYKNFKDAYKLYDFTDMLELFLQSEKVLPVEYAIIDEAQDLTPLQWAVAQQGFAACEHVMIAGDDDQAIYDWCGGSVGHFLANVSRNNYSVLDRTYRLNSEVLELSDKVIKRLKQRQRKRITPNRDVTGTQHVFYHKSLDTVPLDYDRTYMFLSRNTMFLNKYRLWLMEKGLPFNYRGTKYPRQIKGPRAHQKLSTAEQRYTRVMQRKRYTYESDSGDFNINTIHRVKGGEADVVVLMLDFTRAVYDNYRNNRDEELRVLYVALTRARHDLHIVSSSGMLGYDPEFS